MLAVSAPLSYKNERENYDLFQDFSDGNLIDTIDLDDLFEGINDGDLLPDLEIIDEFSVSSSEESDISMNTSTTRKEEEEKAPSSDKKSEESASDTVNVKPKSKENDKAKKSSGQIKNPQGKRKVKVDWTPELHKRFVKAVEKLGVDRAVPSRILELMATDGLTRQNIASHLQKYRARQKHLQAREAEAASWSQRKQMYGGATAVGGGGKRVMMNPWPAPPTMGFPPMAHIRPLHVWGHPPANNSFCHPHHQGVTNSSTPGTPCFPAPIAPTNNLMQRFAAPLMVPGIPPPPTIIKLDTGVGQAPPPKLPSHFHLSKESIDAAIEDVLSKQQLPQLPIGLKPPSIDSVLNELQRQGITKIPPT